MAAASTNDTLAILDEDEIKAKAKFLIAETDTKEDGSFSFSLGGDQKYEGGAFEIDVYCGTIPHRKPTPNPPNPLQFSITTLQPMWKQTEGGALAYFSYCVPSRFWCEFRRRFGAWTICGHVTACDKREDLPVPNVKVSAFDVDWLQDDALGSAYTDGAGHFRIDYNAIDFMRTPFPFINIEWFGGPDLYFKIEGPGGVSLLDEPPSRGRDRDRENAGPCFCVCLCVEHPPVVKHAWFTHVGDFAVNSDFDAAGLSLHAAPYLQVGAHGGPGYGFYDGPYNRGLELIGDCPTTHPNGGEPMRYRFLYQIGANPAVPLTGSALYPVEIGTRPITWDIGFGSFTTPQSIVLAGTGGSVSPLPLPGPAGLPFTNWGPVPPVTMMPDSDGWVTVDPLATNGAYSGALIQFISSTAVPGGSAATVGDLAGNPPGSLKVGTPIAIIFEAEPTTGPTITSPLLTNTLAKILINNWSEVILLDLTQFAVSCCSPLTTDLDIMYTTDHELMLSWALSISSCASNFGWVAPVLPSGPTALKPRGDNGDSHQSIGTWPGCSYLIELSTTRKLTDGKDEDQGETIPITFCIDR